MALVGIDCRFGSALGGLGTYTRHLVTALIERSDPWSYVLFVDDAHAEWIRTLPRVSVKIVQAPFPHYSFQEQFEFPNLIQDSEPDLFFFPHFNAPLSCTIPFICTVHDLILHRFPNESGMLKRLAYRFVLRQALGRACEITTVSDYTKSDIHAVYGTLFDDKISVVYPGVSSSFVKQSEETLHTARLKYRLDQPYLLYVGNCKEHKNVPVLIDAFQRARLPGVELILLTGGRETAHLKRTEGVRVLSGVAEEDLPAVFAASLGCVTATLLEGFCLPLIEAMACHTPVLATWAGPIPEVCGGHALLAEPTVEAMAEGMHSLVTDPGLRSAKKLVAAAQWAYAFTWQRTAEHTAALLKEHLPS
jgi:glycosyltransferase involved in cell wall biosynthesis